jgi:hypothetical protein
MSEPEDPSRLLDAPSTPEGLRNSLRSAQSDVGNDAQLARIAGRLGPLLGAGVAVGGGAAATAKVATLSGGAKLGLAGLALAAVGGGALWLSSAGSPATPSPAPQVVSVAPVEAVKPPPVVANPAPTAAESALTPAEPAVSVVAPQEKPAAPVQLSEAELLEQARLTLKSDPNRALQRANEHARRFPRGVLVQEREVLAIQALRRLGRDAEAERRAEAFAKAFPGSAFQRNLKPGP